MYLCGEAGVKNPEGNWKEAEYAIFDDFILADLKKKQMWKGFASGQKKITLRDLYFRKMISWGKVTIFLANYPPPPRLWDDWDEVHVVVIELKEKMYK